MSEHVERYRLACARWLDEQKAADALADTKNDVLAQMMSRADGSSQAEKERNVRSSSEWKGHMDAILAAQDSARRAKMAVKLREMEFEAWKVESWNNRSERRAY